MNLRFREIELKLNYPFKTSRDTKNSVKRVIVEIDHDGITGIGEAAPSPRYNENETTVIEFLKKISVAHHEDKFLLEEILGDFDSVGAGNYSAKAALDIALHDWIGKKMNIPLWKYFGFNSTKIPSTSFTISIDDLNLIEEKVKQAKNFHVLKIKVGTDDDIEIIKKVRDLTDKSIRVDANEGWKNKEVALEKIMAMEKFGIEFVEQPLQSSDIEGHAWLKENVNIPIIADESLVNINDLALIKDAFDGINIKIMKCGGLRKSLELIQFAKYFGLKIMLGCMIESSVGISAASHIASLADYVDLDGNLLIKNDPFKGVETINGKITLNNISGIGLIN